MRKIQDIKFNKYIELESLIPMYCRGTFSILTVHDGSAKLKSGEGFDFLTYFNSLPIGKWRKYTSAEKFYLVLDVVGHFDIDLVGHLSKENGHQKEWGGRFSYEIEDRQEIVIPISNSMQSELVSFGMNIHKDTYVYGAYYAADVDETVIKHPRISAVTHLKGNGRSVQKNIELLKQDLSDDDVFKDAFDWIIIDKEGKLQFDNHPDFVTIVDDDSDLENLDPVGSYVLIADENDVFSADSFKRLYEFLCILKDIYSDYEITGAVLSAEKPNTQIEVSVNNDADASYVSRMADISGTDLGVWSNVIDNEHFSDETRYIPGLFYCIPKDRFNVELLTEELDSSGTGYAILRPIEKSIRISGICVWAPNVKKVIKSSEKELVSSKKLLCLQDIVTSGEIEIEVTRNMYYRSDGKISLVENIEKKEKYYTFTDGRYYDFFTYFNAFSLEKWEKYTSIENVYLKIEATGDFSISLFGHFKSKVGIQKEWLGERTYNLAEREEIIIPYPRGMQSGLISFGIAAHGNVKMYGACYVTEIDEKKIKTPLISMVTTTFKKEKYIERNIALLSDQLLTDPAYGDYFRWYIIDNGRTIKCDEKLNEKIKIIPNPNVGGAGGFARGQLESVRSGENVTHILFMDDDVVFIPDSFKRLCNFLKVIKDDYKDYFISGAMLKTGQPNIQHENTGWLNELGNNESLKTNFDLNLWDVIINNEEINDNIPNRFAAFWFCCVPTTVATPDNLPLPVFFRGDDIEYSLRNKAKIITMNGLCIWHEGFEGRFSASLDFYLTVRNKLMLCAINPHLNDIDMVENVEKNFWEEMRKYDYKGASFFLDALEDFMKGPEFYRNTDGEANMKAKKAADNKLRPINPEIRGKIDYGRLYWAEPLSDLDYKKYKSTCNLQDMEESKKSSTGNINEQSMYGSDAFSGKYKKKKIGVIPYGWGTWPSKVYKMDEVIAVDPANDTYVIYKKDKDEYYRLKHRFEKLMNDYEKNGDKVIKDYQKAQAELAGESFWDKYLEEQA